MIGPRVENYVIDIVLKMAEILLLLVPHWHTYSDE
jgi:hypothetical protein